jgi:rhodanese-related sulfurtransferase
MPEKFPIKNVNAEEVFTLVSDENFIILDLRTPMEYNASRINGAINIDYYSEDFIDELSKLEKDKPYLVYCRTGSRTNHAMQVFISMGFQDITHLYRGIVDWANHGYSISY